MDTWRRLLSVSAATTAEDLITTIEPRLAMERRSASGAYKRLTLVGRVVTGLMATVALTASIDLPAGLGCTCLAMRSRAAMRTGVSFKPFSIIQ